MDYVIHKLITHLKKRLMDYIIQKLISIHKRLPNCVTQKLMKHKKKRLLDFIIQKLISCIEKTFELCNPETNHKRFSDYII